MRFSRLCRSGPIVVAMLSLIGISGCISSRRIADPRPAGSVLSPKLSPFVFFEDGAVMFLGVDSRAAQFVKGESRLFPVGVGIANRTLEPLTLQREGFVLETASGTRYPLVSVGEFNRDYGRSTTDDRLADIFIENLETRFQTFDRYRRGFFPAAGSPQTASDRFELARSSWVHFYLYFPIPPDGIHGKEFKLLVNVAEHASETFLVNFSVR